VQLLPAIQSDDGGRAGYPSASSYERLLACRASHLLTQRAIALGQVAHQSSKEAELGARKHLANVEGPQILAEAEREDWETCRRKREAFIEGWSDGSPLDSTKEGRLWLRKGIRPLLSGQPDEILLQGKRAAVLDYKFGATRVSDPGENSQLAVYSLLAARSDDVIQEVTCQILSPTHDFEPFTYTREELGQLHQSVLVVINSLSDPGDPKPGAHCQFCPGRLICPAARREAENATLAKVIELPLGEPAARLLEQIKRAKVLFGEIEAFYRRVLEREPGSIPGWQLVPGDVRRSIADPVQALERLIETFSVSEFLGCCSVSVPELEKAWAKKKGIQSTKVRTEFSRCMDGLIIEKRNAPSLKAIN
jgi:Protein of unknown function (DUF2800)